MTSIEDTSLILSFQPKSGSNCPTYSTSPMDRSPVIISAEDLDLLNGSGSLEQEMLLLSGLEPPPSAVGMHGDEFSCLLEHFDKWSSPVEPMFSTWNPRFFYQKDMVDVALSDTTQLCSLKLGKDQKSGCEEMEACEKQNATLASAVLNVPLKGITSPGKRVWKGGPPAITRSSAKSRLSKPSDSSENSEDECSLDGRNASKNLVSERRRRKKLNDRLYSLRALVPKISKMDKASIVSDAIGYVQELQKQVESIQADINALQSSRDGSQQLPCLIPADDGMAKNQKKSPLVEHRILELEVAQMEEQTYHLRIHCKKGPGVLVQLTKALEALDFEIVNANLTSVNDHILNNVVVKAKIGEVLTPEELKKLTLEVVPRFGLVF
ncbi:hypothetical protein L7F22_055182 [Adiantum nelumboides]|nr:hypothetical protein [Adiantum nelumboides]